MPPLTGKVFSLAAVTGALVVFAVLLMAPSVFGSGAGEEQEIVSATVTDPQNCTKPDATEVVSFRLDGHTREGRLSACGHDRDEQVRVALPSDPGGPGEFVADVSLAASAPGTSYIRKPLGSALLVLSSAGGALYAVLLVRGERGRVEMAR